VRRTIFHIARTTRCLSLVAVRSFRKPARAPENAISAEMDILAAYGKTTAAAERALNKIRHLYFWR
jgi:hypothetical protein